jgi:hypothetical protein
MGMRVDRRTLDIEAGGVQLPATFWLPESAKALVISLQPSELDRLMPRSSHVLERLCAHGFGVLAVGLLTPAEESSVDLATTRRFDIEGLAARTHDVVHWLLAQGFQVPIGILAKGTAVAAALQVAARRRLGAIVSVAGRPDLAAPALPWVQTLRSPPGRGRGCIRVAFRHE